MRHNVVDALRRMPQPALVVRGARDPIVPQEWAEWASSLLPRGELLVVPGAAHAVNYNAPRPLVEATEAFLDRVSVADHFAA